MTIDIILASQYHAKKYNLLNCEEKKLKIIYNDTQFVLSLIYADLIFYYSYY